MSATTTTQLAGDQLAPVLARLAHLPELQSGHEAGRCGESVPIEYRRTAGKVRGDFGFPQVAAEMLNAEHELLLATAEPQRGIGRFESVRRARQARAALIEREPRVAAFVLGWELGKARLGSFDGTRFVYNVVCSTCGYAHRYDEAGCMNPQCVDQHGITPERRARLEEVHATYRAQREDREERQRLYALSFKR